MLWVFAGYFGQVLQQSPQLKEVQASVGLVALFLFPFEKAEGCQSLSVIYSQRFSQKKKSLFHHLTGQYW